MNPNQTVPVTHGPPYSQEEINSIIQYLLLRVHYLESIIQQMMFGAEMNNIPLNNHN